MGEPQYYKRSISEGYSMMEIIKYGNEHFRGHYLRHVNGASRKTGRQNSKGIYYCPKCDTQFKTQEYKPHCPSCNFGQIHRVKRGWAV